MSASVTDVASSCHPSAKAVQKHTCHTQLIQRVKLKFVIELKAKLSSPQTSSEAGFIGLLGRIILGYKGCVCKKCLIWSIAEIPNEETRISSRSYHLCDPQRLREAQSVTDIPRTIHKQRQELIYWLTYMVNSIAKQGLVDLVAVEVHASIFDTRLSSYEEYIDLNSLQSVTLDWAYRVAKEGKTMINTTDLQKFLGIFEATLGFFSLTINKVKRYFFVCIANGLAPQNIKYLNLLRESPNTTEIGITTAIDKELKDMFIDGPQTPIPSLRPNKFRSRLQNPTIYELINIPEAFFLRALFGPG